MLHDRGQLIPNPSFILKDEEPRDRCICRFRENLANNKGKFSQNIRSHMRINGEYLPEGIGEYLNTKKVRDVIMLGFTNDPVLMKVMDLYNFLETSGEAVEKQMMNMGFDWDSVELLKTIPGDRRPDSLPDHVGDRGRQQVPVC